MQPSSCRTDRNSAPGVVPWRAGSVENQVAPPRNCHAREGRFFQPDKPSDWEVFASILVNDLGRKLAAGVDLEGHEVKSAQHGSSYEYQYHKITGKDKLRKDMTVGHLFFAHQDFLRHVDLRYAQGSAMMEFFTKWLQEFPDPYRQRYRKNIPFGWVEKNGMLLMTLTDGEVTYPATIKTHAKQV
ncbi:MAG: hypothetical protein ACLQVM_19220 [Terriglobia bacterium]